MTSVFLRNCSNILVYRSIERIIESDPWEGLTAMKKQHNIGGTSAFLLSVAASIALVACGGGGTSSSTDSSTGVGGNAVKGPLKSANSVVSCYPATKTSASGVSGSISDDLGTTSCTVTWTGATMVETSGYFTDVDGNSTPVTLKAVVNVATAGAAVTANPSVLTTLQADRAVSLISQGQDVANALSTSATEAFRAFMNDSTATLPTTASLASIDPFGTSTLATAIAFQAERLEAAVGSDLSGALSTLAGDLVTNSGSFSAAAAITPAALTNTQLQAMITNMGTKAPSGYTISTAVQANPVAEMTRSLLASTGYLPVNLFVQSGASSSGGSSSLTSSTGASALTALLTITQGLEMTGSATTTPTASITFAASAGSGTIVLSPTAGTASLGGSGVTTTTAYSFTYTPSSTSLASDTISVTATTDQGGTTARAFMTYYNDSLQNYPASSKPAVTEITDTNNVSLSITASDSDSGDTLSYYVSGSTVTLVSGSSPAYSGFSISTGMSFTGGLTGLQSYVNSGGGASTTTISTGFTFTGATSATTTGFGHWSISGSSITFEPAFSTTVTASLGYAVVDQKGYGIIQEFRLFNHR